MAIEISIENYMKVMTTLRDTPQKIEPIMARSINRALDNAKTNLTKEIIKKYAIKASELKGSAAQGTKGALLATKATQNKLSANLKANDRRLSLTHFRLTPKAPNPQSPPKKGYGFQVLKDGKKTIAPGGFLAYHNNSLQYFQRTGPGRYPLKRFTGPSIEEMAGGKDVMRYVETEAKSTLNKRIEHELERLGAKK